MKIDTWMETYHDHSRLSHIWLEVRPGRSLLESLLQLRHPRSHARGLHLLLLLLLLESCPHLHLHLMLLLLHHHLLLLLLLLADLHLHPILLHLLHVVGVHNPRLMHVG